MLKVSIISLILIFSFVANAGYERRQKIQNQRIEKNISSGNLNEAEAARLQKGQAKVEEKAQNFEANKEEAKSDGVVTRDEKKQLVRQRTSVKRTQNRQSERVKHNSDDNK